MSLTECLKEGPTGESRQNEVKSSAQRASHNWDGHANQWRSTNLNRRGNMPQYGIKCVIGREKNQIVLSHQLCNPGHPKP